MKRRLRFKLLLGCLIAGIMFLGGCSGDDGSTGSTGLSAYDLAVQAGYTGTLQQWLLEQQGLKAESCAICHSGSVVRNGAQHQDIYNQYTDTSDLALSVVSVNVTPNGDGVTFDATLVFHIDKAAVPYDKPVIATTNSSGVVNGYTITGLEQLRFGYATNDAAGSFPLGGYFDTYADPVQQLTSLGGGDYQIVDNQPVDVTSNAIVYGYIADTVLAVEGMTLYSNVSNAGQQFGGFTNTSTANVSACEKCHGTPYMKHGYRNPVVAGLDDFASCKICHFDTGNGGHQAWQLLVDDPATYALQGGVLTAAQKTYYAYKKTVMNDTHMSHSMEFAYPQSMANCITCHDGNMAAVTDPANFIAGTCKSCHPIDGVGGTDPKRAPALRAIWEAKGLTLVHDGVDLTNNDYDCTSCHNGGTTSFAEMHTGYNPIIYDAASGTKYAEAITASIDSVTQVGNTLDIAFSVTGALGDYDSVDAIPTVMVSFYGYGTKDFIVSNHTSDSNSVNMEKTIGTANALYTEVDGDGSDHTYEVILDYGAYAATPSIPDMIASGVIKRAEIAVLPKVNHLTLTMLDRRGNVVPVPLALDAPSVTFDLTTGVEDPTFYPAIAEAVRCNTCHDQLATTFHTAERGGNVVVCRMCHVGTSGGSHLELQSRSIDSYVHAIHSFQLFDPGDIDFSDPVAALEAEEHVAHQFPNFTRLNCQACHTSATSTRVAYNVPDQSKSMPGVLSGTDAVADRNIGSIPSYVTGPATRACGGCHRADFINADDAGGLAAFNEHVKDGGYLIEANDGVLDTIIKFIMGMFN